MLTAITPLVYCVALAEIKTRNRLAVCTKIGYLVGY